MVEYLHRLHRRYPKVKRAYPALGYRRHFTKIAHLIPPKDDAKWLKDLAKIFVSNIWHLHRLPTNIVSDQDRWFHVFWAEVCDLHDIQRRISMAYHLKSDGETEGVY
jgi:hypothetical protein